MSTEPMIGQIVLFAGTFAPKGWAFCNGSLIKISDNPALYSIIGPQFGGDGRVHFALPTIQNEDMPGKYIIAVEGTYPERNEW